MPGNKILVPGCEPTSTITSTTLSAEMQEQGLCNSAIAELSDVLEAIPEARVARLDNFGFNAGSKILILPPHTISCPCGSEDDWYQIIKNISRPATEDEVLEIAANCNTLDQGFCHPSITNPS